MITWGRSEISTIRDYNSGTSVVCGEGDIGWLTLTSIWKWNSLFMSKCGAHTNRVCDDQIQTLFTVIRRPCFLRQLHYIRKESWSPPKLLPAGQGQQHPLPSPSPTEGQAIEQWMHQSEESVGAGELYSNGSLGTNQPITTLLLFTVIFLP